MRDAQLDRDQVTVSLLTLSANDGDIVSEKIRPEIGGPNDES